MVARAGETISLDSQVELQDASRQFDLATYVAALAFNNAALPPDLPEWLKIQIVGQAKIVREAAAASEDNDLNNPNAPDAKRERERRADEAADIQLAALQQQQREEWARTRSTAGGVTMTGAEWGQLAQRLRNDDELRERVLSAFRARGMSRKEAEARYERVADVAEIMAIPPPQRTEEQKATVKAADADPTFRQDMKDMQNIAAPSASEKLSADQGSARTREFARVAEGATATEPATPASTLRKPPALSSGLEV